MKTLTISQPWATLIAIGAKHIETRSWRTRYRGPLAIHAAKGLSGLGMEPSGYGKEFDFRFLCRAPVFNQVLPGAGYTTTMLPRGAVIATCELVSVVPIYAVANEADLHWQWVGPGGTNYNFQVTPQERAFGDYTAGRYAWLLHNIKTLDTPILAKGALGLWEFDAFEGYYAN
jgi:hypothetical protein